MIRIIHDVHILVPFGANGCNKNLCRTEFSLEGANASNVTSSNIMLDLVNVVV